MKINSKLQEIIDAKRREIAVQKQKVSVIDLQNSEYYLRPTISLLRKIINKEPFMIAEFKRESPAKGPLKLMANVTQIAQGYQRAGASAISILTESSFFKGSKEDLIEARKNVTLPLLRKDFIIDQYQIIESKAWGADLILLIAAILTPEEIDKFSSEAKDLGLEVILEIHDPIELENLNLQAVDFIGVNNRDLKTFITDYQHSLDIVDSLPTSIPWISESGICDSQVANLLHRANYQGFLIGEHFMRAENSEEACANFIRSLYRQ